MRSSNLERQRWRTKCREQLSEHIQSRLGITIEPAQVRLLPSADDPYGWMFLSEKKHLFSKNLSSHSTGAYKDLCDGIGKNFEAISANQGTANSSLGVVYDAVVPGISEKHVSFSSRIDQLQEENDKLNRAKEEIRIQLSAELERREHRERELERLKDANQRLQKELWENTSVARRLKEVVSAQSQGLNAVVQQLQELQERLAVGTLDELSTLIIDL